jgi:hypothetical protein
MTITRVPLDLAADPNRDPDAETFRPWLTKSGASLGSYSTGGEGDWQTLDDDAYPRLFGAAIFALPNRQRGHLASC